MDSRIGTNAGHGHVWKRPDGMTARCGGPKMCRECGSDYAAVHAPTPGAPEPEALARAFAEYKSRKRSLGLENTASGALAWIEQRAYIIAQDSKTSPPKPSPLDMWQDGCRKVLDEVFQERVRQTAKWGFQNLPNFSMKPFDYVPTMTPELNQYEYRIPTAKAARNRCEKAFKEGHGSWGHIFLEEVAEAYEECSDEKLRAELVQVIAVGVQWVEAIDVRTKLCKDEGCPQSAIEHVCINDQPKPHVPEHDQRGWQPK